MKKLLKLFSLFLVACLILLSCSGKKEEVIKIGSTVPLTGEAATWGNYTKKGVELAIYEYNEARKEDEPKFEVIFEDTKADAKEGVNSFNKLVNIHNVQAIVDDAVSSVALAIAPLARDKKVVIISTGATNPKLSGISPYYFRVWNSDYEEGLFSANYAYNDLNYRKVAVLAIENDYGQGLSDVFINRFKELGGEIIITETYKQGNLQFRNQLTKIKNAKPDAIYLVSYPEETPQILIQKNALSINQQIIGTVPMEDKSIIEEAKDAAEGVIYPYPVDPTGESVMKFRESYEKKFAEAPGTTSAEGYDAARLFIDAIISNGNNGDGIKDYLTSLKEWNGVSGIIEFDSNGDVHKPMVMKTIKDSNFISITK